MSKKRIFCGLLVVLMLVMCIGPLELKAAPLDDGKDLSGLAVYQAVFDPVYYYSANPDVASYIGANYTGLLMHYVRSGIYEGRSASATFNATYYMTKYADLSAVYGTDMKAYVEHYVNIGKAEGRTANDPKAVNVKLADVTINPVVFSQLSTCTTVYNARIPRANNVSLAANAINGSIVMPGETFSYSNTVGPRTRERGYVEAPIYVSGQHATGIGGGICQVSSTLYAAMRYCNLPATERHPHSLPVAYLPAGYDATISGTALDLKFKNIYAQPIYIEATADNGNLTVTLYLLY